MELKDFRLTLGQDGIAIIIWECKDKQYNILTKEGFEEFIHLVAELKSNKNILGVILTANKPSFCAGADINLISDLVHDGDDIAEQMRLASMFSATLRELETCGKPVVCAMTGTTLGGGFEIALACHYRIAASNFSAKYGLPEVKIGILPGGGGTQRLPRLIGAQNALEMMLTGKLINDKTALKMGFLHEIVEKENLIETARKRLLERKVLQAPWDRKGYRIPGGAVYSKNGMMTLSPANALYRKSSYDNYPAGRNILKCVYEGLMVNIDAGLQIEARYFTNLLRTKEAKHMMRSIFTSMQALKKNIHKSDDHESVTYQKVGVVGAGLMGSGIAYVCAMSGIEVVLIDQDEEAAQKGYQYSENILKKRVIKGRLNGELKDKILARIKTSTDFTDLSDVDLVIEAVFEDVDVKNHVTVEIAKHVKEDVIIASNTSTLPITELAKASKNAEQFVGIHFFSPVERMMLVEVIRGDKTSQATIDKALDFVNQIKKTPIVVNDSRGFYTSRVVISYVTEAMHMLEEGVPPIMIEKAGKMAGMPVGALTLADEIGLDVAHKITLAHKKAVGKGYKEGPRDRLLKLLVDEHERLGKKNGAGLFDYGDNRSKKIWPGLLDFQEEKLDASKVDMDELGKRFLTIQAVETARCFEENVLTDIREADVGGILGFGFAPFTGGPLSYIDMMGSKHFVKRLRRYAKKYGTRFKSTTGLNKMSKTDALYYDV